MKQIWIPKAGEPQVLDVREAPDPTPKKGQVRIRVEAAGVNFADLLARMGLYPDAPPLPCVVGYEVAGVIDAVGEGVAESRIGENVLALTRFGGYSSAVCVSSLQAQRRPDNIDAATAAGIPVTGLTAWMMLEEMGRIREGDRILVHSAGGGVGLMALDLIKWRGAVAVGTASGKKHAWLKTRGYDELVDYTQQDFYEALKDGPKFDLILDPIGGASWAKGLKLLKPSGRLLCYGSSDMATGTSRSVIGAARTLMSVPWLDVNPITLMNQNRGVMGVNLGHLWDHAAELSVWFGKLLKLVEQGIVKPDIHARVPYTNAAEAHQILHRRENVGKVVITFDGA